MFGEIKSIIHMHSTYYKKLEQARMNPYYSKAVLHR